MCADDGYTEARVAHDTSDSLCRARHEIEGIGGDGGADGRSTVLHMELAGREDLILGALEAVSSAAVGMDIDKSGADIAAAKIVFPVNGVLVF